MLRSALHSLLLLCAALPVAQAQVVPGPPGPIVEGSTGPSGILAPGARFEASYTPDGQSNGFQDFVLWLPESAPPRSGYPLMVFVPGGGWKEPNPLPKDPTGLNRRLRRRGFAVAFVRYSHSGLPGPSGRFPAAEQDIQAVVQHFRFHAQTYRIDPSRVLLNGRSAGGHAVQAAALWADAADPTASDQRRESSRPMAYLLGSVAATHIPTLTQFNPSPLARYLNGGVRLSNVPQALQLEASPTEWIDAAPELAREIPAFIVGSPRDVDVPLGMPFVSSAIPHNHDPWNALTLWFRLRGTGGVHGMYSIFVDTNVFELENAVLFEYQMLWIDYVLALQSAGLLS